MKTPRGKAVWGGQVPLWPHCSSLVLTFWNHLGQKASRLHLWLAAMSLTLAPPGWDLKAAIHLVRGDPSPLGSRCHTLNAVPRGGGWEACLFADVPVVFRAICLLVTFTGTFIPKTLSIAPSLTNPKRAPAGLLMHKSQLLETVPEGSKGFFPFFFFLFPFLLASHLLAILFFSLLFLKINFCWRTVGLQCARVCLQQSESVMHTCTLSYVLFPNRPLQSIE